MEFRGGIGSIGGIPASGGVISLSGADIGQLVTGLGGVVRSVAMVGGIGLGASLLLLALGGAALEPARRRSLLPMSGLVRVRTPNSQFWGFLEDRDILFCPTSKRDQTLRAPLHKLCSINPVYQGSSFCGYDLMLVDGSTYHQAFVYNFELSLITPVGLQKLPLDRVMNFGLWHRLFKAPKPHNAFYLCEGVLPENLHALALQSRNALQATRPKIVEALGRDVVGEFFNLKDV